MRLSHGMIRALELLAEGDANGDKAYAGSRTERHYRRSGGSKPDLLVHAGTAGALADRGLVEVERDYAGLVMRLWLSDAGRQVARDLGLYPDELEELSR